MNGQNLNNSNENMTNKENTFKPVAKTSNKDYFIYYVVLITIIVAIFIAYYIGKDHIERLLEISLGAHQVLGKLLVICVISAIGLIVALVTFGFLSTTGRIIGKEKNVSFAISGALVGFLFTVSLLAYIYIKLPEIKPNTNLSLTGFVYYEGTAVIVPGVKVVLEAGLHPVEDDTKSDGHFSMTKENIRITDIVRFRVTYGKNKSKSIDVKKNKLNDIIRLYIPKVTIDGDWKFYSPENEVYPPVWIIRTDNGNNLKITQRGRKDSFKGVFNFIDNSFNCDYERRFTGGEPPSKLDCNGELDDLGTKIKGECSGIKFRLEKL